MTVIDRADEDTTSAEEVGRDVSQNWEEQPYVKLDLSALAVEGLAIVRSRRKDDGRSATAYSETTQFDEVPPIIGNPPELREVIAGLIMNACEAMPEDGSLGITCRTSGGQVRLEIEDSGCGITEQARRSLFLPRNPVDGQTAKGMGLRDIYEIVKRHGGDLEITSTPGEGTVVALNFCIFAPQDIDAAMPLPEEETGPGRILVIDDELPIAELLMEALQLGGHQVEITGSGHEGIEMIRQAAFDLVLTDLDMPGMSGWEVARRVQEIRPGTPVMLVTGWSESISDEQMSAAGVRALVHKPFEIKELLSITNKNIGGHQN